MALPINSKGLIGVSDDDDDDADNDDDDDDEASDASGNTTLVSLEVT